MRFFGAFFQYVVVARMGDARYGREQISMPQESAIRARFVLDSFATFNKRRPIRTNSLVSVAL